MWKGFQKFDFGNLLLECPNYVRGHLYQVSWHASWDQSANVSKCTHIIHLDLKGSLPGWVVSKGVLGQIAEVFPKTKAFISENML